MTDNEIIKALECCSNQLDCVGCECVGNCPQDINELNGLALDLINRQKAEKEALIAGQETLQKYIAEQKAEIERLEKENIKLLNKICEKARKHSKAVEKIIKAEAIKEFAERLKDKFPSGYGAFNSYDIIETMDDLVNEMVGEQ